MERFFDQVSASGQPVAAGVPQAQAQGQGTNPLPQSGMAPVVAPQPVQHQPFINTSESVTQPAAPAADVFELGDLRLRGLPAEAKSALEQEIEKKVQAYAQQHVSRLQSVYDQRMHAMQQQLSTRDQEVLQAQLEGRSPEDQQYLMQQWQQRSFQQQQQAFQAQQQQFQAAQAFERELDQMSTDFGVPKETLRQFPDRASAYAWAGEQKAIRRMMPQVPQHQVMQTPGVQQAPQQMTIPAWNTPEFAQVWERISNGGAFF